MLGDASWAILVGIRVARQGARNMYHIPSRWLRVPDQEFGRVGIWETGDECQINKAPRYGVQCPEKIPCAPNQQVRKGASARL